MLISMHIKKSHYSPKNIAKSYLYELAQNMYVFRGLQKGIMYVLAVTSFIHKICILQNKAFWPLNSKIHCRQEVGVKQKYYRLNCFFKESITYHLTYVHNECMLEGPNLYGRTPGHCHWRDITNVRDIENRSR